MIRSTDLATYTSPSSWYVLHYPLDWKFEESEECTTFYRQDGGVGALQLSAFETDEPQSASESLRDYLDEEGIKAEVVTDLKMDGQEVATSSYDKDGSYTRIWFTTKQNHLIFLTFMSESPVVSQEIIDVDIMIKSLQIMA